MKANLLTNQFMHLQGGVRVLNPVANQSVGGSTLFTATGSFLMKYIATSALGPFSAIGAVDIANIQVRHETTAGVLIRVLGTLLTEEGVSNVPFDGLVMLGSNEVIRLRMIQNGSVGVEYATQTELTVLAFFP